MGFGKITFTLAVPKGPPKAVAYARHPFSQDSTRLQFRGEENVILDGLTYERRKI
jgi:hypothetical protein